MVHFYAGWKLAVLPGYSLPDPHPDLERCPR